MVLHIVFAWMAYDAAESGSVRVDDLEDDAVRALFHVPTLPCSTSGDNREFLELALLSLVVRLLGAIGKIEVGPLHIHLGWCELMGVFCVSFSVF